MDDNNASIPHDNRSSHIDLVQAAVRKLTTTLTDRITVFTPDQQYENINNDSEYSMSCNSSNTQQKYQSDCESNVINSNINVTSSSSMNASNTNYCNRSGGSSSHNTIE